VVWEVGCASLRVGEDLRFVGLRTYWMLVFKAWQVGGCMWLDGGIGDRCELRRNVAWCWA